MTDRLRQVISDPDKSEAELIGAIARLGPVTEPADFWLKLAGSEKHSAMRRRHFVFQLFHRHVAPGMRLSRLAQMLDKPNWLNCSDIELIEDLGGTIPVQMTADDTVFKLRVVAPGREPSDMWGIYLRVAGRITRDQLCALLCDQAGDEATANAEILEIGFNPSIRSTRAT